MKRIPITILFCLLALLPFHGQAQGKVEFKRTEDVIYGRKFGTALTLDGKRIHEGRHGAHTRKRGQTIDLFIF